MWFPFFFARYRTLSLLYPPLDDVSPHPGAILCAWGGQITLTGGANSLVGRRGCKASSASADSPGSPGSPRSPGFIVWTVGSPGSGGWTVGSPGIPGSIIWTVVPSGSPGSIIWTVVPPVVWAVVPPVCGVCVIWTVVLPISVIPRIVVTRIVVIPVFVVTIPGPVGGAAAQYRHYKKNYQDNQQGFSHCRTPPGLPPNRGVMCFSPLL